MAELAPSISEAAADASAAHASAAEAAADASAAHASAAEAAATAATSAADAAERGEAGGQGEEESALRLGAGGRSFRFRDPAGAAFDLREHIAGVRALFDELGFERGQVDVTWENLRVAVPGEPEGGAQEEISTVATDTEQCLTSPLALAGALVRRAGACGRSSSVPPPERLILNGLTGYARSGELTLVVGPPGSGCSTLCNVLAGRTRHYKAVRGEVRFNGELLSEGVCKSSLGLAEIAEADVHFPTLTVDQTVELATRLRLPLPEGHELRGAMVELRKTAVESILGIHHVRQTFVGDALVRGVSGGERRRVTIAEMLATAGRYLVMDSYTKGLDSAASLDIVRSMKTAARHLGATIIATQYQISKDIFELFDNVVVLREGQGIYFGPTGQACAYFEALRLRMPVRRTVPDFLSTIADDPATLPANGADAPQNVEELAEAYHESRECEECQRLVAQGMAHPPPRHQSEEAAEFLRRQYLVSWPTQFRVVFAREWRVKTQSPKLVVFRLVRFTVVGLLLGATFWQLPEDIDGAYSRGGLLFFSLNYVALAALAQMSPLLDGRAVFYKQRDADFYSPSSYFVASTAADFPLQFVETCLFVNTTYWMIGLNISSGSRFIFYWLALLSINFMMSTFARMATANSPNLPAAQGKVVALVVVFIIFAGYLIARNEMPPYFVWLNWVSPFKYVFEGLIVNEFDGLCLSPSSVQLEGILELEEQLGVVVPPSSCVPGTEYIATTYDVQIPDGVKWAYLAVIWGVTMAFAVAAVFYLKMFSYGGEQSVLKYKRRSREAQWKVDAPLVADFRQKSFERRKAYEASSRRLEQAASRAASQWSRAGTSMSMVDNDGGGDGGKGGSDSDNDDLPFQRAYFEWREMSYVVQTPTGPLTLLDRVSGFAHPGMLTALMGSSGAGKTTLLDVLARRKTMGVITGSVTVNGVPQDATFKRMTGYVEQIDVLHPRLTVRETLQFSAALRLPPGTSDEVRRRSVRDTEDMLSLGHVADAMVGDLGWAAAISLEQRKRLNIGNELVANPSVLFMDEPTSGLDTNAAIVVMRACRLIADSGRSVLCTIHQPSSELFEVFDTMLLLRKGGRTVYFGQLGAFSGDLIAYFERNGAPPCAADANPADWMLTNIGAGIGKGGGGAIAAEGGKVEEVIVQRQAGDAFIAHESGDERGSEQAASGGELERAADQDWAAVWEASPEAAEVLAVLDKGLPADAEPILFDRPVARGFLQQFWQCLGCALRAFWRTPESNFRRMVFNIALGLLIGLLYLQIDSSQVGLQFHVSVIFVGIISALYNIMVAMPPLLQKRAVFYRELASGFYEPRAYALAVAIVELPFVTTSTLLYVMCFYWLVGFEASRVGYFIVMQLVFTFFGVFFGQACIVFLPTLVDAQQTVPTLTMIMQLFCGFLILRSQIRDFLIWIYWVNPYTYYIAGQVINQLEDTAFFCNQDEFVLTFNSTEPCVDCEAQGAAAPEVCRENVRRANDNASACGFCQYTTGESFLEFYSMNQAPVRAKWADVGYVAIWVLFSRAMTVVGLVFIRHYTR